jgi:hypothetical protein
MQPLFLNFNKAQFQLMKNSDIMLNFKKEYISNF